MISPKQTSEDRGSSHFGLSMDFSLLGFILCSIVLGFGIYEATSLERSKEKKGSSQHLDPSNGMLGEQMQMSSLPT